MQGTVNRIARTYCEERGLTVGTAPECRAAMRLHQWGHDFVQQHRVGRYRLDFAWPEHEIALEVDGPHHWRPDVAVKDVARDDWLRREGWVVFRVSAGDDLDQQLSRVSTIIHAVKESQ